MMRLSGTLPILLTILGLTLQAVHAANLFGIAYSPYQPTSQTCLPASEIDKDFNNITLYTKRIRTYGFDCPDSMRRIFELSRDRNVELFLGIWIEKGKDTEWEASLQTMLRLLKEVPGAKVYAISVGNEALLFGKTTADDIVAKIRRVKWEVQTNLTMNIPVTYVDVPGNQSLPTNVLNESDIIALNLHPFWWGYSNVTVGINEVFNQMDFFKRIYPSKRVVCAETGWPSAGDPRATEKLQYDYNRSFMERANARQLEYFMFEMFDARWKSWVPPNHVEHNWGYWTADRKPKPMLVALPY
ncbi:hypothetical protein HK102_002757 [Quaeritorhiza haematococci]|nr:hypothetical protein HK102_002757 [Quaeritorhiza haematococci]